MRISYALPIVLGALAAATIAVAAWPGPSEIWRTGTPAAEWLTTPAARLSVGALALVAAALSAWAGRRAAIVLLLPVALFSLVPPDRLDPSAELVVRESALAAALRAAAAGDATAAEPARRHLGDLLAHPLADPAVVEPAVTRLIALEGSREALNTVIEKHRVGADELEKAKSRADSDLAAIKTTSERCRLDDAGCLRGTGNRRSVFEVMNRRAAELRTTARREGEIQRRQVVAAAAGQTVATNSAEIASWRSTLRVAQAEAERAAWTRRIGAAAASSALAGTLFMAAGSAVVWTTLAGSLLAVAVAAFAGWGLTVTIVVAGNAAVALAMLLAARALRSIALGNAHLWRTATLDEQTGMAPRLLLHWAPIALILVGGALLARELDRRVQDAFYPTAPACAAGDRMLSTPRLTGGPCAPRDLARDVDAEIARRVEAWRQKVRGGVAGIDLGAGADGIGDAVTAVVDANVPAFLSDREAREAGGGSGVGRAFDLADCGWFDVPCHTANRMLRSAQTSYRDLRAALRADLAARVGVAVEAAAEADQAVREPVLATVDAAFAAFRRSLLDGLGGILRFWSALDAVGLVLLVVVALKSFGFVYLRNLHRIAGFNLRLRRAAGGLGPPGADARDAPSEASVPRLALSDAAGRLTFRPMGDVFVAGSERVPGRRSRLARPGPSLGLFLLNLLPALVRRNGPDLLFRVYEAGPGAEFAMSTARDRALAAVRLEAGEALAFRPAALAAFTRGLGVRGRWTFDAVSLLRGRLRSATASGPGVVVLRTGGHAILSAPHAQPAFLEVSGLIAWAPDASYEIKGAGGFCGVYCGTTDVRPVGGGCALGDQGAPDGAMLAVKRVGMLLLPY